MEFLTKRPGVPSGRVKRQLIGGGGGGTSGKGAFLKSVAKKFGLGKRTSPQEKAQAAWELSLPKKRAVKGLKKTKEYEGERFPKKELHKAQEKAEAKIQAEKIKAAELKAKEIGDVDYTKEIVGSVAGKVGRKVMAPALLYSLYEMSKRKKKKKK